MKITAIYDSAGVIIAAVIDDGKYDSPRPVPTAGTQVGTFEVPESARSLALDEICTTHRVDCKCGALMKS